MTIPHYVNEDKSDMRGIKPGWYGMEDDGNLSSGPFSSRQECLSIDAQGANGLIPSKLCPRPNRNDSLPTSDPRRGRRLGGPSRNRAFEG